MKASEIKSTNEVLPLALLKTEVEIDENEIYKAEWVDVNKEKPIYEGFYFILTDEHLIKGVAFYDKEDDTFDVWWATSGKDPKVAYWLKDHSGGMLWKFKKDLKEI